VTTSWWRAPEMWGFADAQLMTRKQLKAMDVFALGLTWAELLCHESVIKSVDKEDPQKLRLFEILQKVDQPDGPGTCKDLGFNEDICSFVQLVIPSIDTSAVRLALLKESEWTGNHKQEQLLKLERTDISTWVQSKRLHAPKFNGPPLASNDCDLIKAATRFSYRDRATVEDMLHSEYFRGLEAETSDFQEGHLDDVREALEHEMNEQTSARRLNRNQNLPAGSAKAAAEESVGRVNAMIRKQIEQVHANRTQDST